MAQDKLTQTQQQCLDYVKAHGGVLIRKPGGFWTTPTTPGEIVCRFKVPL